MDLVLAPKAGGGVWWATVTPVPEGPVHLHGETPPPRSLVPSDLAFEHFVGLGTRAQGALLALDPQVPSRVQVGASGRLRWGHRLLEDLPAVCPHSWFPEQSQILSLCHQGREAVGW